MDAIECEEFNTLNTHEHGILWEIMHLMQMQVVSSLMGAWILQASPVKSEAWYRLSVFFLLCV